MKIAVVGATGLVGSVMLKVLAERQFRFDELLLAASDRSIGKTVLFNDEKYDCQSVEDVCAQRPDLALFSAGGGVSKVWAPRFEAMGTTVIDNSSAWRMDVNKKLIVPEINGHLLNVDDKIIANPNCSTIQLVIALHHLHQQYRLNRLVISTYQSVTGTGVKAVEQMYSERRDEPASMVYPHPIDLNCLPHGGTFDEAGYTTEEMKLVHETRKILGDHDIQITATVVRVPVLGGHSESVNATFYEDVNFEGVRELLSNTPGVTVVDDPVHNIYPMPIAAEGRDDVFVGRIRRDDSHPNGLNLWIVSDNLRKGAATNAVQIAEYLIHNNIL